MDFVNFDIWLQFSSYGQLIIKGILIGIIASAPMGPVGILCIRRTMQKGRKFGFMTGVGAAFSDIIYAIITGFGMVWVASFINDEQKIFWLKLMGSVMLFAFGLYMFLTNPKPVPESTSNIKGNGSLYSNLITGFLLTISNPLIIFLFIATFNMFTFVVPEFWLPQTIGYVSIFGGAIIWWYGLTWIISKVSHKLGDNFAVVLNRVIGVIVFIASLLYAANTLFKLNIPLFH